MKRKKIILLFLIICMLFNVSSCSKKQQTSSEKELNLYIDVSDKNSLNFIRSIVDNYKKTNPNTKVNINDILDKDNNEYEAIKKGKVDILFTTRPKMLELTQKGMLSDLSTFYNQDKINEKFFSIISTYGRYQDKLFGLGLSPYVIEILYNTEAFKKINLKAPSNAMELKDVLRQLNSRSIRVPVIFPENIDIYTGTSSLIANSIIKEKDLEDTYGKSPEEYKKIKEMQNLFSIINELHKQGVINKNTFEVGNSSTINNFSDGNIPLIFTLSFYNASIKSKNVDVIKNYENISGNKGNIPILIDTLLCVPTNNKNSDEGANFIKFVFDEKTQKKLAQAGFYNGSKKSNTSDSNINSELLKQLESANENSIFYADNLPSKFIPQISSSIIDILNDKYSGKEWENISSK